jgi:hypothetical protein
MELLTSPLTSIIPNHQTNKALELSTIIEKSSARFDSTHKIWGMMTLKANLTPNSERSYVNNVDFVVVVDISASMLIDEKLAFVQSSIHHLLDLLNENHRFALVVFNHEVSVVSNLVNCTDENKEYIKDVLKKIQASGSTNISDALVTGLELLTGRDELSKNRISTLMLITDGLSNAGFSNDDSLNKLVLPAGCIFNTFGFGEDHDSKLLHSIALKTQGVYYYVPSKDYIHKIFGECVHAVLSSRARLVKINIKADDGSRIVTLSTPFPIEEKLKAKEYGINVGILYSGEYKSILFRLSLRKMDKLMKIHKLLKVNVEYFDIETGKIDTLSTEVNIERPIDKDNDQIPLVLDKNLNRYLAARTIIQSIELASCSKFSEAQKLLDDCIRNIKKSPSANDSYCKLLIEDLNDCIMGMMDINSFQSGVHSAHAYANMYYMERSTGVELRKHKKKILENWILIYLMVI